MSEHPPTLLIVYLRPDHEEETCYYINKALTTAGITYRLVAQHDERVLLESAAPFVFTHIERRVVYVLHASLVARVIEDMALYVTTGLIFGFAVKGEIALDDEMGVINNLVG